MLKNLIDKVSNLFDSLNYKRESSYVEDIHFPHFKGLEKDTSINFKFPLTVLIGENGCGKTSVLQALETSVDGRSFSQKWFSTHVDPIEDGRGRSCFWFTYHSKSANRTVQILKTRIRKDDNPDYWEPSRPVEKYGMEKFVFENQAGALKTRWEGMTRELIYIDFRAEMTAFDKYFYFEDKPNSKKKKTKQDYIRAASKLLRKAIDKKIIPPAQYYKKPALESIASLSSEELETLSEVLHKNYSEVKIIKHRFYKKWGESVYFTTKEVSDSDFSGKYSEAFAGSGEAAVAKLIYKISRANNGSLVLLDEPEVSLHPGAQKRLVEFLLKQILRKHIQVVLSTHSPIIIDGLPESSIVLLIQNEFGTFSAKPDIAPDVAFNYIGHKNFQRKTILVEDFAAKLLIEKIIVAMYGEEGGRSIDVSYHPGGASDLYKEAVAYSKSKLANIFIVLDKDKEKTIDDVSSIPESKIDEEIEKFTGIKIKNLAFSADSKKTNEQLVNEKRSYVGYLSRQVFFLPANPEEIMWNCSLFKKPEREGDFKNKILEWAKSEIGDDVDANDIKTYQKKLCGKLDFNHSHIKLVQEFIKKILKNETHL